MKRQHKLFLLLVCLCGWQQATAQELLSQGKPCWASSFEDERWKPENANDGNPDDTRWAIDYRTDNPADAWWTVDLGEAYHVSRVEFDWEGAYAKEYLILLSDDRECTR